MVLGDRQKTRTIWHVFWHWAAKVWFDQRLTHPKVYRRPSVLCLHFTIYAVFTCGAYAEFCANCFDIWAHYVWSDQRLNLIILSGWVCWGGIKETFVHIAHTSACVGGNQDRIFCGIQRRLLCVNQERVFCGNSEIVYMYKGYWKLSW